MFDYHPNYGKGNWKQKTKEFVTGSKFKYQRYNGNSGNGSTGEQIVSCSSVQQKPQPKDKQIADCSSATSLETVDAIPESSSTKMDNGKQENGLDTEKILKMKLIIKPS